jgi:phosphoribosyl 1,2-cyclic phosphodiesterase
MQLKILNSNSTGNGYALIAENEILLLEAGVSFKKVKQAIDFKTSKVVGCLVSHSHGDHSKYAKDFQDNGINVYSTQDVCEKYSGHRSLVISRAQIGDFSVIAFPLKHDVPCNGYLIKHPEMGVLLFVTDTYYIPHKFEGLNHIMIEVNYSKDILDRNMGNGLHPVVRNRVLASHMDIETTKEFLKVNNLSKVRNIILLHLSDGNSDAALFQSEIEGLTGKNVVVAGKDIDVEMEMVPF